MDTTTVEIDTTEFYRGWISAYRQAAYQYAQQGYFDVAARLRREALELEHNVTIGEYTNFGSFAAG